VSPVPVPMWQRRAQSRCRCGSGEPSPGADVVGVSPVLVQTWSLRGGPMVEGSTPNRAHYAWARGFMRITVCPGGASQTPHRPVSLKLAMRLGQLPTATDDCEPEVGSFQLACQSHDPVEGACTLDCALPSNLFRLPMERRVCFGHAHAPALVDAPASE
jgi:hypothetical protein